MNKTFAWIVGVVVVILIIVGVWWMMSTSQPAVTGGINETASTTPEAQTPPMVTNLTSSTTAEVIASISGTSEYAALLSSTGVASAISGKGPYTVFVSTDMGFGLLPAGTVANMTAAQKKRMLQYSVVPKLLDIDAQFNGSIATLSGDTLNFTVQKTTGLVEANSSFALAEYKTKNGIIYVMNQPLLPPAKAI